MTTSNLPTWPGADAVYSRAYRLLEWMGQNGHVQVSPKRRGQPAQCFPSEEMRDLITALDKGDEERIKGLLLSYRTRSSYLAAFQEPG